MIGVADISRWQHAHAAYREADRAIAEELNGAEISPVGLMVLVELEGRWEFTQSDLQRVLSLSRASVRELITRLEGKGLVKRRRPEPTDDQRNRIVILTDAGLEVLREACG